MLWISFSGCCVARTQYGVYFGQIRVTVSQKAQAGFVAFSARCKDQDLQTCTVPGGARARRRQQRSLQISYAEKLESEAATVAVGTAGFDVPGLEHRPVPARQRAGSLRCSGKNFLGVWRIREFSSSTTDPEWTNEWTKA